MLSGAYAKAKVFLILLAIGVVGAVAYSRIYPQDPCDLYPDLQCGKYAPGNGGNGGDVVTGSRTCIVNASGDLPTCTDGPGGDGSPKKTLINGKSYTSCSRVKAVRAGGSRNFYYEGKCIP